MILFAFPYSAFAHIDTEINRQILTATKSDTSRTDKDKLFTNRCDTIKQYVGFEESISGQAREYSCNYTGVGIALYAGSDLGKHSPESVGQYFISELKKRGVSAQFFIKPDHEYGSSMAFFIDGRTWLLEPINPLEGIKDIDFLANETKLLLLKGGRITEWPKSPS